LTTLHFGGFGVGVPVGVGLPELNCPILKRVYYAQVVAFFFKIEKK
jgi:hypothetical protein